ALLGSWAGAAGAIAAAAADTWATEIGAYSPFPPRLITSGKRVTRGTSGGITALGTLGAVAGAALIAGLTAVLAPRGKAPGFVMVAAAGVAGMLADSVLGATLQGKDECPAWDARFERGSSVCHEPVRLARRWRWVGNGGVNLGAARLGAAAAAPGGRRHVRTLRRGRTPLQLRPAAGLVRYHSPERCPARGRARVRGHHRRESGVGKRGRRGRRRALVERATGNVPRTHRRRRRRA